jgi:hypothetical protein
MVQQRQKRRLQEVRNAHRVTHASHLRSSKIAHFRSPVTHTKNPICRWATKMASDIIHAEIVQFAVPSSAPQARNIFSSRHVLVGRSATGSRVSRAPKKDPRTNSQRGQHVSQDINRHVSCNRNWFASSPGGRLRFQKIIERILDTTLERVHPFRFDLKNRSFLVVNKGDTPAIGRSSTKMIEFSGHQAHVLHKNSTPFSDLPLSQRPCPSPLVEVNRYDQCPSPHFPPLCRRRSSRFRC